MFSPHGETIVFSETEVKPFQPTTFRRMANSLIMKDLLAHILQHEIDHLNGVLFVDRLSPAKRDILLRKLKKTFLSKRP